MKTLFRLLPLVLVAAVATSCAMQKAPAEAAIKAAEEALAAVASDAAKYVPDQFTGVNDAINAAKDAFAKGNYAEALTGAQELPGKIDALRDAVVAKKNELTAAWKDLSSGLPGMVDAIKSRVEMLSKSRRLPKDIDPVAFDGAKKGLETIATVWTEATSAFDAGDLVAAVTKANQVKSQAAQVMEVLKMQAPPAAK